jgi:hypothetical protein
MSPEAQETPLDLKAFVELLRRLDEYGIPFAVIGGMAVGAYARLRGETLFSAELDIVTTEATLQELIEAAPVLSLDVVSRPQPRSVPVAVMKWRGLEVNVLTASRGLPDPEFVVRGAREFQVDDPPVVIPIADPLDLLGNIAGHIDDAKLARTLLDRMERRGAARDVRGILVRRGLIGEATDTD